MRTQYRPKPDLHKFRKKQNRSFYGRLGLLVLCHHDSRMKNSSTCQLAEWSSYLAVESSHTVVTATARSADDRLQRPLSNYVNSCPHVFDRRRRRAKCMTRIRDFLMIVRYTNFRLIIMITRCVIVIGDHEASPSSSDCMTVRSDTRSPVINMALVK